MDFHALSRRELQALCKMNKIPANMTNIAMADALAALPQVEGLEEFLNHLQSETNQLEENDCCETPGIAPRTATRMSTRRKPNKESSVLLTRAGRSTRKVPAEKAEKEKEGNKGALVSEDDKVVKTEQRKPPVQKVYSTRRSVRLLERTMADLSLSGKKSIEPIKMDELEPEMTKEVAEHAIVIKEADGDNPETVSVHGWEKNDSIAPSDQKQTCPLKIETQAEDGSLETPENDNVVEVSAGVDSDLKDVNHEAPLVAENANETDMESNGEYDSVIKGADTLIEVMEQIIPTESQKDVEHESSLKVDNVIEAAMEPEGESDPLTEGADQLTEVTEQNVPAESQDNVVPEDTSALEVCDKIPLHVENHPDTYEDSVEGLEPCSDMDKVHSESQDREIEVIPSNGVEVVPVGADVMDPDLIDIPVMAMTMENAHSESQDREIEVIPSNGVEVVPVGADVMDPDLIDIPVMAMTMENAHSESQDREIEVIPVNGVEAVPVGADVMDPDLIDIPVMAMTVENAHIARTEAYGSETATVEPPMVDISTKEAPANEVAAADLQQFQLLTLTPRKVEACADSDGMLNIEQVTLGKIDGLPQSLNTKTPTSTKKLLASPLMTNKENIIVGSTILGDPDAKKAKIRTANVNEDSKSSLDEKSLRQLSKMLKEKLQLANKPGDYIPELTGKARPALQALPNNRLAVSKNNDN